MPEQQVETQSPANGARPLNGQRPSRDTSTRATLLAGLEKLSPNTEVAPTKPVDAKPAANPDGAKPAEAEAKTEPEEPEPEPEEETEPGDEPKEKAEADAPAAEVKPEDPELSKRLATVQKAEKRAREQLAKERADIERHRTKIEEEWSPRIKAAERFEALAKRAKHDPAGVLQSLGLTDDDMEPAARHIFSRSPRAAEDPKNRDAADRAMREREHGDRLETMQKRIDELESGQKAKEQQAVNQRQADRYIDSVVKAVGDDAPLVASVIAKNPDKARYEFSRITVALHERDGEIPDADDVIAEYERIRREELEELGIDPATVVKAKKKPAAAVEEKRTSKTLGDGARTTTATQTKGSFKDKRRDVLRALESEKLD